MSAANYNLVIEQGVTFDQVVTLKTATGAYKDLTGYSARMKIKDSPGAATTIQSLTSPVVAGLGIDVGTTNGQVRVQIPAATTAGLDFFVVTYDLEVVSPTGEVTRVIQGKCTLSREVTS